MAGQAGVSSRSPRGPPRAASRSMQSGDGTDGDDRCILDLRNRGPGCDRGRASAMDAGVSSADRRVYGDGTRGRRWVCGSGRYRPSLRSMATRLRGLSAPGLSDRRSRGDRGEAEPAGGAGARLLSQLRVRPDREHERAVSGMRPAGRIGRTPTINSSNRAAVSGLDRLKAG